MSGRLAAAALAVTLVATSAANAFHDGGVAACNGCHTMHASQDGVPPPGGNPAGNPYLLLLGNPTDVCLTCHASRGAFDAGEGHGPGGDFYWVTRTYTWSAHGHAQESPGDAHGHNVFSKTYDISSDAALDHAPGGDFLSGRLSCTSCHDPHGNTAFRMLYGTEVGPVYGDDPRYKFTADPPLAAGNGWATQVGSGGEETDAQHTVHKSGMSEWCANCHFAMHSANTMDFVHPTGFALGETAGSYNAYVSSTDTQGGNPASAYRGLVPFEDVDVDLGQVDPTSYTAGPDPADLVMCLTCHRAHASAFRDIGRWDFGATFLNADSHPQLTDGGASAGDVANRYYAYAFPDAQRSLCNKCHVKDAGDRPLP